MNTDGSDTAREFDESYQPTTITYLGKINLDLNSKYIVSLFDIDTSATWQSSSSISNPSVNLKTYQPVYTKIVIYNNPKSFVNAGNVSDSYLNVKEIEIWSNDTYLTANWVGFKNLETIVFTNKIREILANTFSQSTKLKTVYFKGTPQEYQNIVVRSGNAPLLNANVVYIAEHNCEYQFNTGIEELPDGVGKTFTAETYPNPLPTPTCDNMTFGGWYKDNGTFQNVITAGDFILDDGTNLYAKFANTITYHLDGGSNNVLNPSTYTTYDVANNTILYAPTKATYNPYIEYQFDGWYTESTFVNQVYNMSSFNGAINLYAKFKPVEIYQPTIKVDSLTVKSLPIDAATIRGQQGYTNINASSLTTMEMLRQTVDNLNQNNYHALFDFSAFITGAYVCLVQCYNENDTNYCYIKDLINKKVYGNNTGYSDETTVSDYLSSCTKRDDYQNIEITDLSTMSDLATFISNINAKGEHVFFDFHHYMDNAYVCTVLMYNTGGVNYCFIYDLINGKLVGNYLGYTGSTTIQNYCNQNANDLTHAITLTDTTMKLEALFGLIDRVNVLKHHVFFDVSALTTSDYLTTFTYATAGTNTTVKAVGLVKGVLYEHTYASSDIATTTVKSFLDTYGLPISNTTVDVANSISA